MFEHLVARESALDRLLPRPRLSGRPSPELMAKAREWSDAVWDAAERLGPLAIGAQQLARGRELASRPVFICGVHRSGTTLVHDLLDGHPALAVLPSEGSFYTNHRRHLAEIDRSSWLPFLACEWCRRLANPINQPPYWLIGRSTPEDSPSVAFVRSVAAWWTPLSETPMSSWPLVAIALGYASFGRETTIDATVTQWVEKTPTNERFLSDIWNDFPEARVIHLVRDPVAVLASRKVMEQRATGGFGAIRTALADLADSYRIADVERARDDRRRYLLVRFEELLDDPDSTIERLAAFLDIDDLPILRRPTTAGRPASNNSSFATAEGGVIDSTRRRVEAAALSADERLRLAVAVGDAAAVLGYAVPA